MTLITDQMPGQDVCILQVTSPRYLEVAEFTENLVNRHWSQHPSLYRCGLEQGNRHGDFVINRAHRDWIGILHDAVTDLQESGYDYLYLLLDDHAPVNTCNALLLNRLLPGLMRTGSYLNVVLHGYTSNGRQGQCPAGDIVSRDNVPLERLPDDWAWRFSLHPGLWSVSGLAALTGAFLKRYDDSQRTAWQFERRGPALVGLLENVSHTSMRIAGHGICARSSMESQRRRLLFVHRLRRFISTRLGIATFGERAHADVEAMINYFCGPYPMVWSGLVKQGCINPLYLDVLRLTGMEEERNSVIEVLSGRFPFEDERQTD